MSICNPLGYDRPEASLHYTIKPGAMPFFTSIFALSRRYSLVRLWGISPPEFIQAGLHLLGHSSAPILAPSPLPLLFFLSLSPSKTLAMAPPLFHPLAGSLTIFSQPGVAIECSLFPSSRTSFLLCFLHFRYWACKYSTVCSTAPTF